MSTDIKISNLIINKLSKEQYSQITPNPNELYLVDEDFDTEGVLHFKGSVATYADLPSSNVLAGDTYKVNATNKIYVYYQGDWEEFSGSADVDLTEIDTRLQAIETANYVTHNELPNGTLTIKKNGTSVGSFSVDTDASIDINVPTTASDIGAAASSHTHTSANITDLTSTINTAISGKADANNVYTKNEIDGKLTSAMHYKGTVANAAALENITNPGTGDVYNVTDTGANYAYNGSSWDKLSENIDLSGCVPTSRKINGKALTSDITLSASDVNALPSNTTIPTTTSSVTNNSTAALTSGGAYTNLITNVQAGTTADKIKVTKAGSDTTITINNVANATNATKATQDGSGNVITSTYENVTKYGYHKITNATNNGYSRLFRYTDNTTGNVNLALFFDIMVNTTSHKTTRQSLMVGVRWGKSELGGITFKKCDNGYSDMPDNHISIIDNLKIVYKYTANTANGIEIELWCKNNLTTWAMIYAIPERLLYGDYGQGYDAVNTLSKLTFDQTTDGGEAALPTGYTVVNLSTALGTDEFIKSLSVSGTTITYTKGNGSTGTISTQDNKVTQTEKNDNANYRLLACPIADATGDKGAQTAVYDSRIFINPASGRLSIQASQTSDTKLGGYIDIKPNSNSTTTAGSYIRNYDSKLQIFGIQSSDGTTKVGTGTTLTIDPYGKTITGGYTITGDLNGNADTATKLGTANKGSATQPIYLDAGEPKACTYTIEKSVPSNAVFTDTNTLMTQNVTTGNSAYPLLMCPTANATTNQGAKTGIFASGVKLNPSAATLELCPCGTSTTEGAQINLYPTPSATTMNGISIDLYNGDFRIFGMASADGTTRTGSGTPLVIDPYDKTITGGYTITGNLTGNVTGNVTGSSGSCTGNAATATTATKLGTTTVGGQYLPVYLNNGTATAVTVKNLTEQNNLDYSAATGAALTTTNTLAYWNGRYNGTGSNLLYCNKGEIVGTTGAQTISGAKTFSNTITSTAAYAINLNNTEPTIKKEGTTIVRINSVGSPIICGGTSSSEICFRPKGDSTYDNQVQIKNSGAIALSNSAVQMEYNSTTKSLDFVFA